MVWLASPTTHRSVAVAEPGVEQPLLQRRDVLVLVDDEVPVPARGPARRRRRSSSMRAGHDQQQVGEVDQSRCAAWPARTPRRPRRPSSGAVEISRAGRFRPGRHRSPASRARPWPSRSRQPGRAARRGSRRSRCRAAALPTSRSGLSTRSGMPPPRMRGAKNCSCRSAAAWKVRACTRGTPSARSRVRISPAARVVNVTASSWSGGHRPGVHCVGDAVGDRPGLAGAGAGQDADRAADRLCGRPLFRVEPGEHGVGVGHVPMVPAVTDGWAPGCAGYDSPGMRLDGAGLVGVTRGVGFVW